MEHIRPLVIKYIYTAAITMIFLSHLLIPAVPLGSSLIIALFVTAALYLAGDRYLLQRFGALLTSVGNFVIAAIILALAGPFVRQAVGAGAVLATAAATGVAEWVYYRYIRTEINIGEKDENIAPAHDFFDGSETPPEIDEENPEQ